MQQRLLLSFLLMFLSGCGGGNGTVAPTNTNTVSTIINGTANLGIVSGASIAAYQFINGAAANQLGSTQITSSIGGFSLNIGTYTGLVMLIASNPTSTATYVDEAKGRAIPMGANSFRAILTAPLTVPISITPLTEMVTAATIRKINAGVTDTFAMAESAAQVGAAFINGAHPLYHIPMDISTRSTDTIENEAYASSLAGLAVVAAAANKDIITTTGLYTNILFSSGNTIGSLSIAQLNELRSASLNFNGSMLGLNTPRTTAIPTGTVNLGTTALNKQFFYVYQNIGGLITTVLTDTLETGSINVSTPNSLLTPFDLWHATPTSATQQALPAIDNTARTSALSTGTVAITTTRTQHMQLHTTNQGTVMAGTFLNQVATSHEWSFAVKQPAVVLNPTLVAATYRFISMGQNNAGHFTQDGTLLLNADNTLSLTENRTNAGTTLAISQTQNFIYSILLDNRISIALPNGTQVSIMLTDGLQYGLFSEINPNTGAYSTGFIIRQHNNSPYLAGRNYHYMAMSSAGTQLSSENGIAFLDGLQQFTGGGQQLITDAGRFVAFKNSTLTGKIGALSAGQGTITFNQKAFPTFYSNNGEVIIAHNPGISQIIMIRQ